MIIKITTKIIALAARVRVSFSFICTLFQVDIGQSLGRCGCAVVTGLGLVCELMQTCRGAGQRTDGAMVWRWRSCCCGCCGCDHALHAPKQKELKPRAALSERQAKADRGRGEGVEITNTVYILDTSIYQFLSHHHFLFVF